VTGNTDIDAFTNRQSNCFILAMIHDIMPIGPNLTKAKNPHYKAETP
jgi:hypothetical protein